MKLAKAKDAEAKDKAKPAAAKAKLAKVEEPAPKPEKFSKTNSETADAGKTDKTPTSSIPSKQEEKEAAADFAAGVPLAGAWPHHPGLFVRRQ